MLKTNKVVKKAKLLTSNFTLEEQIQAIEKTFYSLGSVLESSLKFNKIYYEGISVNNVSFFYEESSANLKEIEKGDFLASFSFELLLELFQLMEQDSDNRMLLIKESGTDLEITDFLMNKDSISKSPYSKYKEFELFFDTRIFYYFKLNRKTINKNTNIYLFERCLIISSTRKKKELLFMWSF